MHRYVRICFLIKHNTYVCMYLHPGLLPMYVSKCNLTFIVIIISLQKLVLSAHVFSHKIECIDKTFLQTWSPLCKENVYSECKLHFDSQIPKGMQSVNKNSFLHCLLKTSVLALIISNIYTCYSLSAWQQI